MSNKDLPYDGLPEFAEMVLAALRQFGPAKTKDLVSNLRVLNGGHPPNSNAVNDVLQTYLKDEVQCIQGLWSLRR